MYTLLSRLLTITNKVTLRAIKDKDLDTRLDEIGNQIQTIVGDWIGPLFLAIGGVAAIYAIVLGVQYARSENDAKKIELKSRIVNCVIGLVIILVLGAICVAVDWKGIAKIFGYIWDE